MKSLTALHPVGSGYFDLPSYQVSLLYRRKNGSEIKVREQTLVLYKIWEITTFDLFYVSIERIVLLSEVVIHAIRSLIIYTHVFFHIIFYIFVLVIIIGLLSLSVVVISVETSWDERLNKLIFDAMSERSEFFARNLFKVNEITRILFILIFFALSDNTLFYRKLLR